MRATVACLHRQLKENRLAEIQKARPAARAEHRLQELERSSYRRIIESMQKLLEEFRGFYLHPSKRWECPWALDNADLTTGSHALDAGCGGSIFPVYVSRQGYHVSACDVDLDRDPAVQVPVTYVKAEHALTR